MKKFEYSSFTGLFSNFCSTVEKSPLVIFIPLSLAYMIALQVLLFVKRLIECLYGHFQDPKDEPTGVRVAKTIVFGPVNISSGFVFGALDIAIFVIGFFYDITNKIMSLNKSETYFVEI